MLLENCALTDSSYVTVGSAVPLTDESSWARSELLATAPNVRNAEHFHWLFSLIAEEKRMHSNSLKYVGRILALAMVAIAPIALAAQDAPKPATKPVDDSPSRWDIFAGYSYLGPHGTVNVPQGNGTTLPFNYDAQNVGSIVSGAYFFNKYVGGQVEVAEHE